jgi:hypothetical protein
MRFTMDYGLGRIFALDHRDTAYPMRMMSSDQPIEGRRKIWWDGTFWPNQGDTPECVEYAWHNYVSTKPINSPQKAPYWEYDSVYNRAQQIDEWEGEDYDGTSVRAGAKVMQELGFVSEYHWAWDVETVIRHLIYVGPVVVGTNWYTNMFFPDSTGKVSVGGFVEGGHAYLLSGVNMKTGIIRAKNSWGREWGRLGRFSISIDDLARLIDEDGEACVATEISV